MSAARSDRMLRTEYLDRVRAITSRIRAAEALYARATDYRYTPLTIDGAAKALSHLQSVRAELADLHATYHAQQIRRGE